MSKRLQVLLDDGEYREIAKLAAAQRTTLADWVRDAIRKARQSQPSRRSVDKLRAVRTAVRHEFPSGDIDQTLAEIERGYGDHGLH
jgi:hypothetical protein